MIDFGRISPNRRITIAIGIMINLWGNKFERSKYTVANDVARILERFVPIRITDKYSGFLSMIEDAKRARYFPVFPTHLIGEHLQIEVQFLNWNK